MSVENPEYAAMMLRLTRAHGRRMEGADLADLADLIEVRDAVEAVAVDAVRRMRARGESWTDIATATGFRSRQAATRYWTARL